MARSDVYIWVWLEIKIFIVITSSLIQRSCRSILWKKLRIFISLREKNAKAVQRSKRNSVAHNGFSMSQLKFCKTC